MNTPHLPDAGWVQNFIIAIPLLGGCFMGFRRWASSKERRELEKVRRRAVEDAENAKLRAAEDQRHAVITARLEAHDEQIATVKQGFDSLRIDLSHQTDVLAGRLDILTGAILSSREKR